MELWIEASIPMVNSQSPTVIQKLILAALVCILGCLVAIIVQNGSKSQPEPPGVAEDTVPSEQQNVAEIPETPAPVAPRLLVRPAVPSVLKPMSVAVAAAESRPANVIAQPVVLSEAIPAPAAVAPVVAAAEVFAGAQGIAAGAVNSDVGSVVGHVTLVGMPQAELPINMDATCGRLNARPLTTRHYVVSPNGGLANVLVYVQEGLENRSYRVP